MNQQEGGLQLATGGVTAPRLAAAGICADLRTGQMLDRSFERHAATLDARDRRWLRELMYGMLRHRSSLDAILQDRVHGGLGTLHADLLDLLRIGVFQLMHMGSVPPYAAIAQTVELAKVRHGIGASRLTNAVLRRIDRESGEIALPARQDMVEELTLRYSHPAWLVRRWLSRWGEEATAVLLMKNNAEAPLVIRPWGIVSEQLEATLEASGVEIEDAPLVRDSIQIAGPISLAELGAFRQGLFFVQDAAATLVTQYAAFPGDTVVADLCAAPGGKALELARTARLVLAGDRSPDRLSLLEANRQRLGADNIRLLVSDARRPAVHDMDAVLIDVPCTGTGTFRRHPDARWRLRVSDLQVMARLQAGILEGAAQSVRRGGLLVYSTCSLEPEENDAQVESFLARNPGWTLEPPAPGAVPPETLDGGFLRVLPQAHGTDGAFAARLRRME